MTNIVKIALSSHLDLQSAVGTPCKNKSESIVIYLFFVCLAPLQTTPNKTQCVLGVVCKVFSSFCSLFLELTVTVVLIYTSYCTLVPQGQTEKNSFFLSFFLKSRIWTPQKNAGFSKWARRRGVGARDGAPGGLRGVVRGEDDAVRCAQVQIQLRSCCGTRRRGRTLILLAFITGNSSLEPLLEGLFAQIHVDLSWRGFGRNRTEDLRITQIC